MIGVRMQHRDVSNDASCFAERRDVLGIARTSPEELRNAPTALKKDAEWASRSHLPFAIFIAQDDAKQWNKKRRSLELEESPRTQEGAYCPQDPLDFRCMWSLQSNVIPDSVYQINGLIFVGG